MRHSISVIMPNYNGSEFLAQAIGSVIAQSFRDFELILVDDGSEDSSVKIMEGFRDRDERIQVIVHERNKGVSAARNTGLARASSALVTFMDSDDLMARERLERLVSANERTIEPRVIYSDMIPIDESTKSIESRTSTNQLRPSGLILGPLITGSFRFIAGPITAPRSIFAEVGPYDEGLSWGEDFELCLRLAKNYPFEFDPVSTYGHRMHSANATAVITREERWAQQATILERHMKDSLPKLNTHERRALYRYLFSCYVASNQLGKILSVGVSDKQAFLSMLAIPGRALGR